MTDTTITTNPQSVSTANVLEEVKDKNLQTPISDEQTPSLQVQDDNYTLSNAAANGDFEGVKRLMEKEGCIPWGYGSALILAAKEGHDEIVRHLIECKIKALSLTEKYKDVSTNKILCKQWNYYEYEEALREAVDNSQINIAKYLLQRGIGKFPAVVGRAAEAGNFDMVKLLVQQRGDITRIKKGSLDEASYKAVLKGSLDILKYLVEEGANIDVLHATANASQDNLLSVASRLGHLGIVHYLFNQKGADIHVHLEYAFYAAVLRGHLGVVKFLVEQGANIHFQNENALHTSAEKGHMEIVKYLVEQGADIHARQYNGNALSFASRSGHFEVVRYLVEAGADIYANDEQALKYACKEGHMAIVKYLVKQETNVVVVKMRADEIMAG